VCGGTWTAGLAEGAENSTTPGAAWYLPTVLRWSRRSIALLTAVGALAGLGAGAIVPGCGTDAVGVDACRRIETARCEAAVACGYTADQVTTCKDFYRDQCLHGLQNNEWEPSTADVDACVAAIGQVRVCAERQAASMAECAEAPLAPGVDGSALTPCAILTDQAHRLDKCDFVVMPADAGPGTDGGGTDGAGSTGDGAPGTGGGAPGTGGGAGGTGGGAPGTGGAGGAG